MAGAAAGVALEGGAAAGGAEAMLGKEGMSLFSNSPGSADGIASFASKNNISPKQTLDMVHKLFGQNPGEPNAPEHHKDPVKSFMDLLAHMNRLAKVLEGLSEAKSKLNPTKPPQPEPTSGHKNDEKEQAEQAAAAHRKSSMSFKPKGMGG